MKTALAVLGVLVATAVLAVAAWQLGWFVEEKNVNRRARIDNDSFARQKALAEEANDKTRDARDIDVQIAQSSGEERDVLTAQRRAVVDQACDAWGQINDTSSLPPSVQDFALEEC
jgi:hypothetical protein